MQSVQIPDPFLCKLVTKHGEPSQFRIQSFRKIRHPVVPILHKVCYQLRILAVILELAVVLQFLDLFDCVRIDLYHTDPV